MKQGFTGTRRGMTDHQKWRFGHSIGIIQPVEFHHGDCIGADSDAHDIVREVCPNCKIVIHPCNLENQRAFKQGDVILEPKPPLERNKTIVEVCDGMIATPGELEEQLRSGTWATIRYARKMMRPMMIMFPKDLLDI